MSEQRDELHHSIDSLPDAEVEQVLVTCVGALLRGQRCRTRHTPGFGAGPANNGRSDNASRVDELLAEGFGRH